MLKSAARLAIFGVPEVLNGSPVLLWVASNDGAVSAVAKPDTCYRVIRNGFSFLQVRFHVLPLHYLVSFGIQVKSPRCSAKHLRAVELLPEVRKSALEAQRLQEHDAANKRNKENFPYCIRQPCARQGFCCCLVGAAKVAIARATVEDDAVETITEIKVGIGILPKRVHQLQCRIAAAMRKDMKQHRPSDLMALGYLADCFSCWL